MKKGLLEASQKLIVQLIIGFAGINILFPNVAGFIARNFDIQEHYFTLLSGFALIYFLSPLIILFYWFRIIWWPSLEMRSQKSQFIAFTKSSLLIPYILILLLTVVTTILYFYQPFGYVLPKTSIADIVRFSSWLVIACFIVIVLYILFKTKPNFKLKEFYNPFRYNNIRFVIVFVPFIFLLLLQFKLYQTSKKSIGIECRQDSSKKNDVNSVGSKQCQKLVFDDLSEIENESLNKLVNELDKLNKFEKNISGDGLLRFETFDFVAKLNRKGEKQKNERSGFLHLSSEQETVLKLPYKSISRVDSIAIVIDATWKLLIAIEDTLRSKVDSPEHAGSIRNIRNDYADLAILTQLVTFELNEKSKKVIGILLSTLRVIGLFILINTLLVFLFHTMIGIILSNNDEETDPSASLKENLFFGITLTLLLLMPMFKPVDKKDIDLTETFSLFTYKNWYSPEIVSSSGRAAYQKKVDWFGNMINNTNNIGDTVIYNNYTVKTVSDPISNDLKVIKDSIGKISGELKSLRDSVEDIKSKVTAIENGRIIKQNKQPVN